MSDAAGAGAAVAGFLSLLTLSELTARRWSLAPEAGRKLAHASCGLLAAALPLWLTFGVIAAIAAAFVPFMLVSRRVGLFPIVHGGERTTYGEVYFPLGVLLAALFVQHDAAYSFGVLVLAVSDAVAGVAGERFGRRSYRLLGAHKTYLGSGCFLVTTTVLGAGELIATDRVTVSNVMVVAAVAAALTLEEGLAGGGTDNVVLPVSAGALLHWAL